MEKKKMTLKEVAMNYKATPEDILVDRAVEEALAVITDGKMEIVESKTIFYDKKNSQYSIKIPKSLALKAGLTDKSEFNIIINLKQETINKISSSIIIFKKEEKNGEKEKAGA